MAHSHPGEDAVKLRRGGCLHRLVQALAARAARSERDRTMLEEALGHAYEGIVITDAEGYVLKSNQAYTAFLGVKQQDIVGRHVTEVIENTRMHVVAKTGVAEIAQLQKIKGHEMICSRIPIFEHGKVVAVVGKIIFQDVDDLFALSGRFGAMKKELDFYKSELRKRLAARHSLDDIVGR